MPVKKTGRLERLRLPLECVAHIAVILAVPLFFVQQWQQEKARVEQRADEDRATKAESAMRFIQMANDSEWSQLRANLYAPLTELDWSEAAKKLGSDAAHENAVLQATSDVTERDIQRLIEFYQSVVLCRTSGYCDVDLIDKFFMNDIRAFYCFYLPRIRDIATSLARPDYASDLKAYFKTCPA